MREALRHTATRRWRGQRSIKTNISQAEIAIATLESLTAPFVSVAAVTPTILKQAVDLWFHEGYAPASIVRMLNCLSCLGVDVKGCRPTVPRKLKWWLKPSEEAEVCAWLRREAASFWDRVLADLIEWTTMTGLRLEESLRLQWADIMVREDGRVAMDVMGTKTAGARATLPVSTKAAELLVRIKASGALKPFPAGYDRLNRAWVPARIACGLGIGGDPKTATMKAFRRSAARSLHMGTATKKAMPLDAVRQYLRHANVQTTMGYLKLTGGIGEEEMRQWFD